MPSIARRLALISPQPKRQRPSSFGLALFGLASVGPALFGLALLGPALFGQAWFAPERIPLVGAATRAPAACRA